MQSSEAEFLEKQKLKNQNLKIVNNNLHFLVDENITASNMMSSQNRDKSNIGLIHVNDQSQERTDDNAFSSQTKDHEGLITQEDF